MRYTRLLIITLCALYLAACIPSAPKYQSLSACEKEQVLWKRINDSKYDTLPQWQGTEIGPLFIRILLDPFNTIGLVRDYLDLTFSNDADETPPATIFNTRRTRVIHSYGSVATIEFEAAADTPFTGLYRGVPCGLARFSIAGPPSEEGITAGIAIKFLIDGQPSANFVSMFSLSPQQGYNFFKHDLSNIVSVPSDNLFLQFGLGLFSLVSKDPKIVDIAYMAALNTDGSTVDATATEAPWQLILKPNSALSFSSEAHDFRDDLKSIEARTTLYEVYAKRRSQLGNGEELLIGKLINKTPFVSSSYGDNQLFFKHDRIDDKL